MSRRHKLSKRKIICTQKNGNDDISKFTNTIMIQGKKSLAQNIIYKTLTLIKKITNGDPTKIFKQAIENVRPITEVKSRRLGGANYQVPVEVAPKRSLILSFRWIKNSAKKRKEQGMHIKLANELIDASNKEGESIKKKEQMHRMADANKAFAHYLW